MRVLVTGGTGVVGTSTITALLQRGHSVRLLSRRAERDARQWPHGVTPWPGDVSRDATIQGSAQDCDAVVHLVAIAEECPPEATFDRVNVQGTRNMVREAERAGVPRFVYVSSLGADRGDSPYHRSKFAGEEIVRGFRGKYVILRPGAVYGPGDEHVSVLVKMMRVLPVVPVIGGGERDFQPLWHEDAAEAIAIAAERDDLAGRTLDLAGPDRTSQRDLMDRLRPLIEREPVRVPIPEFVASLGIRAAEALGMDLPFTDGQMTMLVEGNTLRPGEPNVLETELGVRPTPLSEGLAKLADASPELLPDEGVGTLKRKRFWADIHGGRYDADALFDVFRARFTDLVPRLVNTDAESTAPTRMEEGETLTLGVPLRGHIQVRVAEVTERKVTLLTLEGHPLAGAVRFLVEERGAAVRFEVQVYDRAASVVDLLLMRTLGERLQDATWVQLVENVVTTTGGTSEGVQRASDSLDEAQAELVEQWVRELALALRREEAGI